MIDMNLVPTHSPSIDPIIYNTSSPDCEREDLRGARAFSSQVHVRGLGQALHTLHAHDPKRGPRQSLIVS